MGQYPLTPPLALALTLTLTLTLTLSLTLTRWGVPERCLHATLALLFQLLLGRHVT